MKFLTLISGKTAHIAPETKRISSSDFSELLEAKELIEKIKQEGIDYQEELRKKGEQLFEVSKKKGYEEGLKKWTEQLAFLEQKRGQVREELQKFLVQITIATAKKVVGREIQQNPSTIADIVMQNLRSVAAHQKITIYVNKADYERVEKEKEKLKAICDQASTFKIQPREDIHEGGAVIETDQGIVDARAETLWTHIEKALTELIEKKNQS